MNFQKNDESSTPDPGLNLSDGLESDFVMATPLDESLSGDLPQIGSENDTELNGVLVKAETSERPSASSVGAAKYLENDPEQLLKRQTAVAGAVTSLFLGAWSLIFSWLTGLAIINALLGLCFGVWGLNSNRYILAIIGMVLSAAGFISSLIFTASM